MFLLHEYDIISGTILILAFVIFGVLAPIREGPKKLSCNTPSSVYVLR